MATKSAEYMVKHPGHQIVCCSLTEDQAKLIIMMTLIYLENNYKNQIKKGVKRPTSSSIRLKNGSSILARPVGNTGDAVRGFNGHILIIDEGSRFPELAFTAATPVLLTTGGKMWICSTPHGKQGYFYKSWQNKHGRFKIWNLTSEEVIRDRKLSSSWSEQQRTEALEYLEQERKDKSALEFGQEYEGKFIDDLRQLFPDKLIQECMRLEKPEIISKKANYSLGVDIARMGADESTFEVLQITDRKNLIHVEHQITTKTRLTDTAQHIFGMNNIYDFRKIYVDDEGIGIGVFDMLLDNEDTRRKTEALRNSKKIIDYKTNIWSKSGTAGKTKMLKQDLYMHLLKLMEQGRIAFLKNPNICQSFKSVQYEYTNDKKGKPFLHIFGNYTHIVEGLIRAAWIAKEKNLNITIDYI